MGITFVPVLFHVSQTVFKRKPGTSYILRDVTGEIKATSRPLIVSPRKWVMSTCDRAE